MSSLKYKLFLVKDKKGVDVWLRLLEQSSRNALLRRRISDLYWRHCSLNSGVRRLRSRETYGSFMLS